MAKRKRNFMKKPKILALSAILLSTNLMMLEAKEAKKTTDAPAKVTKVKSKESTIKIIYDK